MALPAERDGLFWAPRSLVREAHVPSLAAYWERYRRSLEEPHEFWGDIAKEFYWRSQHSGPFLKYNFDVTKGKIFIEWMKGATTNICYNLLDRNVNEKNLGDKIAFYWEGNEPGDSMKISYSELLHKVCQFANVLREQGVKKGDRVSIYMPMIIELVVAMLACARIGALHSIVFAGFSAESLCDRILDSDCSLLITADAFYRGDKLINLKQIADEALQKCKDKDFPLRTCIVVKHLGREEELMSEGIFSKKEREEELMSEGICSKKEREEELMSDGICSKKEREEELMSDGICSKSPPLKRLCQDLQEKKTESTKKFRSKASQPSDQNSEHVSKMTPWNSGVDHWWHELIKNASKECEPEWCDSEDELFILYTSGSTGKPKGVVHTVGGYMIFTAATFKYVFDHHPEDIYWCTADIGWITGHSYLTYGPLANGATSVLFEGLPIYPDVSRMWSIVDKYKVTKFYTAPTAIRLLMKYGDEPVRKHSRKSLKVLGTVGEPINPEAWLWYYQVVGEERCPIVDTFWQTETGGHVLTPLPAATPMKPGSATFPFFGVVPAILNEAGVELEGEAEGYLKRSHSMITMVPSGLGIDSFTARDKIRFIPVVSSYTVVGVRKVFKQPWPGIMRTVYRNHQRFETTYFKKFPGYYVTGDGCKRDKDGYYWITGRIDDMLNVSGHLLSTAEVESALVEHSSVAEAAVVSHPHPVKGECLYCFVTLRDGHEFTKALTDELRKQVREKIGPIATPDYIQHAPGLPKTRSGKIMRRILRKIAKNDRELGETSTVADPAVIKHLFSNRCETVQ